MPRAPACRPTRCVTRTPPTCSRAAPTSGPSRSCSATPTSSPRRSTRTSTRPGWRRSTAARTHADESPTLSRTFSGGARTGRGVMDDAAEVQHLWQQYKASPSQAIRDRLILHYAPLVKYVAGRVSVGLPANIEQGDLITYGIFGLIDAIDKYDPTRNIKFETYALARIKGAIIDELRAIDWVPRSIRA